MLSSAKIIPAAYRKRAISEKIGGGGPYPGSATGDIIPQTATDRDIVFFFFA